MRYIDRLSDNFWIRNATVIIIGILTLVTVIAALGFWRQEAANAEARSWIVHTYEVRRQIRLIFGEIKDAEISQRTYLITGQDEYLKSYEMAFKDTDDVSLANTATQHRSIDHNIAILRKLTSDNPGQQKTLDDTDAAIKQLLEYLTATIQDRQSQGAKAIAEMDFHREKELMDHVRDLVGALEAEEGRLLAIRFQTDTDDTRQNNWTILSGIALFYAAMASSVWFYQRIRERARIRLSAVVDNALDGLITINERGVVEQFNPACERIFGYKSAEVIGNNSRMLMPEPYHDEHDGYISRYLSTGEARMIGMPGREVSGKRKDGSIFPMDISISAFELSDGRHFSGIIRDITVRKRAEEANALLAAVVASSDDAIVSETLDGVITSWNASAQRLFGYSAGEAIGEHVSFIVPPGKMGEQRHIVEQLREGEQVQHFETERLNKNGQSIQISLTVSPVRDAAGRIIGASKILRDITAQKAAEEKLLAYTNALERSNKELDDFAYIASHDLKEPLRGLFNNAKFLEEDYKDKIDAQGVGRLQRLGYLTQRMEQLVNDLLYFSRLGRQDLAIVPTDLNEVVRDIESMMETTLRERNAAISIPNPLPEIVCDKTRVTEIFRNLITNAIKYNERETKLVEIGYLNEMQTKAGVEKNVFYVRDNGIGIEEEFHEEIFRIFKRLNDEADDKKGTGVGLTFVRKIIDRHGGRIWLESALGKGTTFYFTINQGTVLAAAA
jgi:PAS domain S-box-containing protein